MFHDYEIWGIWFMIDMIWYDIILMILWYEMIWYDSMIWYYMILYDIWCMIWYDMIVWYNDMIYDMIWYDCMIYDSMTYWYDLIWYDMIWTYVSYDHSPSYIDQNNAFWYTSWIWNLYGTDFT